MTRPTANQKGMRWARVYTTQLQGPHLSIRRRDGRPVQCKWDVLQRIKNDTMGPDVAAVEVFPREADVVNEQNTRHLWVVQEHPGWTRHPDGTWTRNAS